MIAGAKSAGARQLARQQARHPVAIRCRRQNEVFHAEKFRLRADIGHIAGRRQAFVPDAHAGRPDRARRSPAVDRRHAFAGKRPKREPVNARADKPVEKILGIALNLQNDSAVDDARQGQDADRRRQPVAIVGLLPPRIRRPVKRGRSGTAGQERPPKRGRTTGTGGLTAVVYG